MTAVQLTLSSRLYIRSAPDELIKGLKETLTLPNPKWLENERMGRWNRRTPKELRYYRKLSGGGLRIPRGFTGRLIRQMRRDRVAYELSDQRCEHPPADWTFRGQMRPFQ